MSFYRDEEIAQVQLYREMRNGVSTKGAAEDAINVRKEFDRAVRQAVQHANTIRQTKGLSPLIRVPSKPKDIKGILNFLAENNRTSVIESSPPLASFARQQGVKGFEADNA